MHVASSAPRRALAGFAVAAAFLAAACGDDDDDVATERSTDTTAMPGMTDMQEGMFSFGEPADPADATRTIEVSMSDDFRFDPPSIDVQVGETVLFEVTNDGAVVHEFVVGDEEVQDEHEQEMATMGSGMAMADEPNSLSIEPGNTEQLAFTFTTPGELEYGCHEAGHYAAGMIGELMVD